ncbi:hypothetical protein [Gramella sp. KN1008]|uniref:hypothetical protein n=1 Tax=Gramella sp. KN1008 TaxID=2529298 RepID=UPI00103D9E4B|nr:hypothetical protein [Gramella sp. KN1008]TBW27364.1 hypothetical protein EZJ28_10310 [Gramella sp. KN1008]
MENITYTEMKFWHRKLGGAYNLVSSLAIIFILSLQPLVTNAQTHPYGFLDGNCFVEGADGYDWDSVYDNNLPAGSISTGILFDDQAQGPDNIFTGGSTKDHLPLSGWQWKIGQSSDKTNIQQAGAVLIDGVIYFFGNRFSDDGATNIGFWFFQDEVQALNGTFTGEHMDGDVLVVAEITNGGNVGNIAAYVWRGPGAGNVPNSTKSMEKVADVNDPNILQAIVNVFDELTPFPHQTKGIEPPDTQPPVTFFEGFLNLADLELASTCFSSFLVETRSSFSLTSILEDFVLGEFNVTPEVETADVAVCYDDLPATLSATGSGGAGELSYHWTGPNDFEAFTQDIEVSVAGDYTVTVAGEGIGGGDPCESEPAVATLTVYDQPVIEISATDISCYGEEDGVVSISNASGYDLLELYQVNNEGDDILIDSNTDGSDFTGLGEGSYYVIASFDHGDDIICYTTSNTVDIEEPPLLELTLEDVTHVSCYGYEDGAIDITASGGTGEYTYDWADLEGTDDPEDRTGLTAGFYSVTVTDENGCTASLNDIEVEEPTELVGEITATLDASCYGFTDGEIDITISGGTPPYSYDWADLDEENEPEDRTGIGGGGYSVTVTDANDCTVSLGVINLDEPLELLADPTPSPESCEYNDGSLSVSVEGGTAPYEYSLDGINYQESNTFTGLAAGDYTVYTRDDNDCVAEDPVTVDPPENCVFDEGCTLGYWKNHTDRWCEEYLTCNYYGDVFEDAHPKLVEVTLLEALNLEGGGIYNLARQSVAALLNTCSSEVGFAYSDVEALIADVNYAFTNDEAGAFGMYLDGLNQAGCPLFGTEATTAPTSPECDVSGSSVALSTSLESEFSVAPVPFVDQLSVQYHFDYVSDVNIQFFNISGQMLQNFKFLNVTSGDISEFNVGSLVSPGQAYILKVNTDRESFSKTIISAE